jgi:hypothetical protein
MDADACVDARVVRDGEVGVEIAKAGDEGDEPPDARGARSFDERGNLVLLETMRCEMAVGVG